MATLLLSLSFLTLGLFTTPIQGSNPNDNFCMVQCAAMNPSVESCPSDTGSVDCVCTFSDSSVTALEYLFNCVSCNDDFSVEDKEIGMQTLADFQEWTYICNVYVSDSVAAASSLYAANSATMSALIKPYSSSLYPHISSLAATAFDSIITLSDVTPSTTTGVTTATAAAASSSTSGAQTAVSASATTASSSSSSSATQSSSSATAAATTSSTSTSSGAPAQSIPTVMFAFTLFSALIKLCL